MGIRKKILLPFAVVAAALGAISLWALDDSLTNLEYKFVRQILAGKAAEVQNAIENASQMTLEQAAPFSRVPGVIEAHEDALAGNPDNLGVTEQAAKTVDQATALSGRSGEPLQRIVELVHVAAAQEQSSVSEHISQALDDVHSVSTSTAKDMDASASSIHALSMLAQRLRSAVTGGETSAT